MALGETLLRLASHAGRRGIVINAHTLPREQIRRYVETLGRHFDFIHHDDLLQRMATPGCRPFCLWTFDDGKLSHATEIATELSSLGVPAVFYLVTKATSDGVVLWFDHYAALCRLLDRPPPGLEPDKVKLLPMELLEERLQRAVEKYGVSITAGPDVQSMDWDQARSLARKGFTIGAHTCTHPILTLAPRNTALHEIEESIRQVSDRMGQPCPSFAFPNGNYTAELAQHAHRCGVRTVMTTEPMWLDTRFPPWRLPRIQLARKQSAWRIQLKIALAAQPGILADGNGTGRVYWRIQSLADRARIRALA